MAQTDCNLSLNDVWSKISEGIDYIYTLQEMSATSYQILYTHVYDYIINTKSQTPSSKTGGNTRQNNVQDGANIVGGELYSKLKNHLKAYLEKIYEKGLDLQGEDVLRFYTTNWEQYRFSSKVTNGFCHYLNRHWVRREYDSGRKDVYEVFTMAMEIWQLIFFQPLNRQVTLACLQLIKAERNNEVINTRLISRVIQSYVELGFTENQSVPSNSNPITSPTLAIYKEYFETQFLQETEQLYQSVSKDYMETSSTNEYIKKVTQRIKEEARRAKNYLHPTTLEKLKPMLDRILIKDQLELIHIESRKLLREEKLEDLRILFELVDRVNNANEPIQKDLENYAYEVGMDAINRISASAIKDPKSYIETIIAIYEKFFKNVNGEFCSQHGYTVALDKAFSKFINDNAVTREAKKSTKSAELLARYCDTLLRKRTKAEESAVEEKINQIMAVFNYIEDKDVFQKYYGTMLAKRLVGQLSASDDYEESMISKLKAACGFEYASKLQRMFQDIRLTTSLIEQYKTYCENKHLTDIVDFSVMVLTSNSWPFTAPATFNLSIELKSTFDSFKNFYSKEFPGRKLEWLYQHSKGELQTLYTKPKYILQVSTYQMTILLLFNKSESMTVETMLDKTQIEGELFTQVLLSLLRSRVLKCLQISVDELNEDFKENDIQKNYTIQVNEAFKSQKGKINLNQPIKSVKKEESETVNQSIEEDREIVIQLAIVRIMKVRKTLQHALLMQEVIEQLSSRFHPQVPVIKKCIDLLIEKEYLARQSNEKDVLHYLA